MSILAESPLANEWHPTLNGNLTSSDVTSGSGKKVWWLGKCGHEWDAVIKGRSKGAGCPYCSGRRILVGFNDLGTTHPHLVQDWADPERKVTEVTQGSVYSAQWRCVTCSYVYTAMVASRAKGNKPTGCPACAGRVVHVGFNDLATTHPEIAAEWHPTLNGEVTPQAMTRGYTEKVWWLGKDCGHSWEASPNARTNGGTGCAVCSGRTVVAGVNDLATTHPELVKEWHPTKNGNLAPEHVSAGGRTEVWWQCRLDSQHEWRTKVSRRGSRLGGCPVCSNRKVIPGINDLATTHPELAKEWKVVPGSLRNPANATRGSDLSVEWVCSVDSRHVWVNLVKNRILLDQGCPACAAKVWASRAEGEVAEVLSTLLDHTEVLTSVRSVIKGELDVYIPERHVAVEFNGLYWHSEAAGKDRNYHALKTEAAAEKGIHLIHVWEDDWRDRRDIVVRALAHRLGATERLSEPGVLLVPDESLTRRYGARTLAPEVLTHAESAAFLEVNHIQGLSVGTVHTGLRDTTGILRAVFVAKRVGNKGHEGSWRIERYATRGIVPGGFTKLMKFTEKQIREQDLGPITQWVTFSDGALSDGGLYRNYGFEEDGFVRPDYQYVVKATRVHKFNYRLNRFRTDSDLEFEEGLSERELALLNKIPRIWDSGKTRWVKPV